MKKQAIYISYEDWLKNLINLAHKTGQKEKVKDLLSEDKTIPSEYFMNYLSFYKYNYTPELTLQNL